MANFTPGPWTVDLVPEYEDGTDCDVMDKDGFPVATVEASPIINRWKERFPHMDHWAEGSDDGRTVRERPRIEYEANARLISAAPELLEACEAFYTQVDSLVVYGQLSPMVRATFEKCLAMGAVAIEKAVSSQE